MIETLTSLNWAAVGQIILIDILLGGDNAVVIALACRNLPPRLRMRGIWLGTLGAILVRVLLVVFAVALLKLPFLKLIGGLLLIWIGVKLLMPEPDEDHKGLDGGTGLASAVRTVILADIVMSLDNVIGIAGAAAQASPDHQTGLVVFGLLVSVPIIIFGSRFVLMLIERYPLVVMFGGALLGWIAGQMIITDAAIADWLGPAAVRYQMVASLVGALVVLLLARVLGASRPAELGNRS